MCGNGAGTEVTQRISSTHLALCVARVSAAKPRNSSVRRTAATSTPGFVTASTVSVSPGLRSSLCFSDLAVCGFAIYPFTNFAAQRQHFFSPCRCGENTSTKRQRVHSPQTSRGPRKRLQAPHTSIVRRWSHRCHAPCVDMPNAQLRKSMLAFQGFWTTPDRDTGIRLNTANRLWTVPSGGWHLRTAFSE